MCDRSDSLEAKGGDRNLQLIQIKFLNAFDAFCKDHKLHYWLDFGTLLGAARNSKFIPWDDDIDVSMLRGGGDFEAILNLEKSKKIIFDGYYFKYYPEIGLIKLHNQCLPEYIGMDIFVLDLIGRRMTIAEKVSLTRSLNSDPIFKNKSLSTQRSAYFARKLHNFGFDFVDNFADAETVVYGFEFHHASHPSIFLDKDELFPLRTTQFEGRSYPCPKNLDHHLTLLYGNYKTPNWKQLPHTLISKLPIEDLIKISHFIERQ